MPLATAALQLVSFYAVCAGGWLLFEKLKTPTAAILGSIVLVGLGNVLGLPLAAPAFLKPCLSIIMGVVLGLRFNLRLRGLLKEILLVGLWLVGLSLLAAKALALAGVDTPTALFAAMPGGIAEISLVALGFGANAFVVALLQSTRLLLTMLVFPALARRAVPGGEEQQGAPAPQAEGQGPPLRGEEKREGPAPARVKAAATPQPAQASGRAGANAAGDDEAGHPPPPRPARAVDWALIPAIALAAAALCQWLHMPAGTMVGPMLAVGLYTKGRGFAAKPNKTLQKWLQAGVGGLVGLGITRESAMAVGAYILPIVVLNVLVVGGSLLLALLLQKLSGWGRATCLLCCCPAGLSPTILLSMELSADSSRVVLFQVLRLVCVLLVAPLSAYMLL